MQQKKLGLALSGGGIEGFSHIGVLKALKELDVEIQCIAGSSSGSVVAALCAMGYEPEEAQEICLEIYSRINKLNKGRALKAALGFLRRGHSGVNGLIDTAPIENIIDDCARQKGIEKICDIRNMQLGIVASEAISLRKCIFCSEKPSVPEQECIYVQDITPGKAVRASMAFPGVFQSVFHSGYQFLDGGTLDNLPTGAVKGFGAEGILAVDFYLMRYQPSQNLEDHALRALDLYSYGDVKKAEELADVVLTINNIGASIMNVQGLEETIQNGYEAVMRRKQEILALAAG